MKRPAEMTTVELLRYAAGVTGGTYGDAFLSRADRLEAAVIRACMHPNGDIQRAVGPINAPDASPPSTPGEREP